MFKFKGISSKEMDVHVTEIDNLIRKAPQRYEEIHIDGRDGAFFHPLGYSPIEVPLELTLMKPERIDEVLQWLNGTGWLEYNGRKTKAHIFSEVEPVRASTVRIIQVTIVRNPFWERVEDDWEEAWGANLIKNGWDDFGAFRSGTNYVENWNFKNNNLKQYYFRPEINYSIEDSVLDLKSSEEDRQWGVNIPVGYKKEKIVFRMKYKSETEVHFKGMQNAYNKDFPIVQNTYGSWRVYETVFEPLDDIRTIRLRLWLQEANKKMEVDWIQVTPANNQHFVMEKTPLKDGLTKIRTWGGNSRIKLKGILLGLEQRMLTWSLNVTNLEKGPLTFNSDGGSGIKAMKISNPGFYTKTSNKNVTSFNPSTYIRTDNVTDSLDFIASDPIIVEGDRAPNWQATSEPAIYNEGTAVSKPLIKLEKGKDRQCEFEVNGTYFKFHFNDDDHVILDCEEMEATYNGFNRNRHLTIGFEWPKLKPKENFVKRISGDAKISFKRKDRWL